MKDKNRRARLSLQNRDLVRNQLNIAIENFKKEELQKIYRAILRFEVYKLIRSRIRKAEKKEDFIKQSLNDALGIDFEKYGTKLPELFQKKENPEYHEQFYINKNIIKEYMKSIGWTELIPFSFILFSASLEEKIENVKNLEEYKFENIKEEFGINYDFDKFIIFNIVQSLIFKEKIDRDSDEKKIMKIMDSNNEKEIDNFLKAQVKHIYAAEYAKENQKQIKKQFDIISNELLEKIIYSQVISEFNDLMRNGITKGYLTHKILNDSSKGYIDLKKKLLDEKIDVPLRYEKIKSILSGKDEAGGNLWNNGNALRVHRKDYQKFIQKNKPNLWEEICNVNIEHKYREKINRQGHSNSKKSYWAIGFDTIQDFYKNSLKNIVEDYKKIHNNCCGLGDPKKSLKNEKKLQRKMKRKEYRQKKKENDNKTDNKNKEEKDDKRDSKKYIRGRRRYYRGRGKIRKPYRKSEKEIDEDIKMKIEDEDKKMKIEDLDEDDEYYDEMEEESFGEIGRKKKKDEIKRKKKEKEDKKLIKKINNFKKPKK